MTMGMRLDFCFYAGCGPIKSACKVALLKQILFGLL